MTTAAEFRSAIQAAGLIPPEAIEADGKLRRFASNGKPRDDAGWYILFGDDIPAGSFGDWRSGKSETWRATLGRKLTPREEAAHRARVEAMRRERAAEDARRKAEASERAATIWNQSQAAPDDHSYLARKHVKIPGLKVYRGNLDIAGMRCDGALVVPIRDGRGDLQSVQFIAPSGEKRFLPGARVQSCYFAIATKKPDEVLCIAEGVATGASIHAATAYPIAVAFDAGNLKPVAETLRGKYPAIRLVICGDNDANGTGQAKAEEAACAVGGLLAVPDFGSTRPEGASDFNDLALTSGAEAIASAIRHARPPAEPEVQANSAYSPKIGEWPEPQPLPEGLPPVATFDAALLPETLKPWALDICERVQCPPEYVGVTVMAALGSVIGRKVGIRPQSQTDWTEFPNQWALIVGRPGVLKSPAMEAALSPLKRLAARATEAHRLELQEYQRASRMAELRAEAGEKAARAKLAKNPDADVSADLASTQTEAPAMRRYIANDTTAAALGELHRQNANGLLVYRDEMVSLLKVLDREDNAEARGFYLTAWNGNSPYTFDRIGRGMNLHIPAVCLSLLGSTQPGRIAEYLHAAVKGGAGDDGLIQRFGLLVWPDTGSAWRDVDRWPDSAARHRASGVFEALDRLDAEQIGGQRDEFEAVPFLRFDADALGLFREWREGWESKLRAGELHPALESHLAKYRKLVPGLALILHLANDATGPVGERATLQALAWAEYLETHARRAYASVVSPEVSAAKAILEKLRRGDLSRTFAARDIYRRGWAQLSDREHVLDALQLFVDLDRLAIRSRDTGGRVATVYEANPRGLEP